MGEDIEPQPPVLSSDIPAHGSPVSSKELRDQFTAIKNALSSLEGRINDLQGGQNDIVASVNGVQEGISGVSQSLSALEQRIVAVESLSVSLSDPPTAADIQLVVDKINELLQALKGD